MFEVQDNSEREAEIKRLEAKNRAIAAGYAAWENACTDCGLTLTAYLTKIRPEPLPMVIRAPAWW